jgi:hypothetical protein
VHWRKLIELPMYMNSKTEIAEPMRPKLRKLQELPMWSAS